MFSGVSGTERSGRLGGCCFSSPGTRSTPSLQGTFGALGWWFTTFLAVVRGGFLWAMQHQKPFMELFKPRQLAEKKY